MSPRNGRFAFDFGLMPSIPGSTSFVVMAICVPLYQLDESNVSKCLGGDRLSIHMVFSMTFSRKTNGFREIITLFCCERDGSVAPTWNLLCNWGTRSVYHAYADAEKEKLMDSVLAGSHQLSTCPCCMQKQC